MATVKSPKKGAVPERLLAALDTVDRPGDFCCSGDTALVMPGLEVDELGTIALPLTDSQARRLIKRCSQAPYGKGTETVVDTEVRNVWELGPRRFSISNPRWNGLIDEILATVKGQLGLEQRQLKAKLYKLLVYEQGSFFLPHRDGEKLKGMVATLVVALPSMHEGGELIVEHDGASQTISMSGAASGLELSYAAFYADCQHEVRPVTRGHRLCLTYNISLAKSKTGLSAPSYEEQTAAIAEVLGQWRAEGDGKKLAITLDHLYTQDGLAIDRLKGIDRTRAEILFAAAERAGLVGHLALLTLWQSGSAEGGYEEYSYGRGRGYRRSCDAFDDDEHDYDETASEYVMGEVYDSSLSATHWSDRSGHQVALGEIRFDESEIVSGEPMEDWQPSREDFEGFTGNAGMTLDRWYHRAAVVLWPRDHHFDVLCDAGTDASIGGLQSLVGRMKRAGKKRREELRDECKMFAAAIIRTWNPARCSWSPAHGTVESIDRDAFPEALCQLGDVDLVRAFVADVLPQDSSVGIGRSLVKFCNQHQWDEVADELGRVLQAADHDSMTRNVLLLQQLCTTRDKNPQHVANGKKLCGVVVKSLLSLDESQESGHWRARQLDRSVIIESLVKSALAVGAQRSLNQLLGHTISSTETYDLTDAHLAAIFRLKSRIAKLSKSNGPVVRWLQDCQQELQSRTAQPPQPPADFRRERKLSCNCGDCLRVNKFLADPNEKELRLPMAKERRKHLHSSIDSDRCDLTHTTLRSGRPFTLICTKTDASYRECCKIFDRDRKNLARLEELIESMT